VIRVFVLAALVSVLAFGETVAQSISPVGLRAEMVYGAPLTSLDPDIIPPANQRRSVPLAFAMSAVLPGAGQAYNRQWVKAATAIGIEIGILAAYLVYQDRAVDARDAYIDYAHAYWSPTRYAHWLNDYRRYLNEFDPNRPITRPDVMVPTGIDFTNPDGWTDAQRRAVRSFFEDIQGLENHMYHHGTGASFAHRLPFFGDQQYYELIGKYFHYAPGWEDYYAATGVDGRPTWYVNGQPLANIDPEETDAHGNKIHVQGRFWEYAQDHAYANDLFRRARFVSMMFVVNHAIAAVDAAVFAKLHNDRLEARMDLSYDNIGGVQPGAVLSYRF
jgi:hypothetical protein